MLIVCTRDQDLRAWAINPRSGAGRWGAIVELPPGRQQDADAKPGTALGLLTQDAARCLSAHGGDEVIGDEGPGQTDWTGGVTDTATLPTLDASTGHRGPVPVEACAKQVCTVSARPALAPEKEPAPIGLWVYGYSTPVPAKISFSKPSTRKDQRHRPGTQVDS